MLDARALSPRAPLFGEEAVDGEVGEALVDALGLAQDALAREAEALGDGAAPPVGGVAANLDAVEPQHVEGVVEEDAAGFQHQPAALERRVEAVAEARRARLPVHVV